MPRLMFWHSSILFFFLTDNLCGPSMDLYQILTHDVYLVQFETLGEKSRVSPLLTILGAKNCHF